jgi:hypothetical protein
VVAVKRYTSPQLTQPLNLQDKGYYFQLKDKIRLHQIKGSHR